MNAKVKEALFELIRSMTKSEKRYFKLMASRHTIGEENNYVVLFDFIDKQEAYDEEAIFRAFQGEAFLNKFSITKKRLYDHILLSLDAFHASSSQEAQIYRLLHSAQILYNKSLYDQARRVLLSAEKQSLKLDDPVLLQKISQLRKKLLENEGYTENTLSRIKELAKGDQEAIRQLQLNNQLWHTKSELMSQLRQKGVCRTDEELLFYKSALSELPVRNKIIGFENNYLYNQIQSICSFAAQSAEEARHWIDQNIKLFRENNDRIVADPSTYVSLISNAIYLDENLGNRSSVNQLLVELRTIPKELERFLSEDQAVKLFASINSVELGIHLKRGDIELALGLMTPLKEGLKKYGSRLSPSRRAFLSFKIAVVYLASDNYSESLKWINRVLNDKDLDPSEDILSFTFLIELLVHLELGHKDLIQYAVKNTQRFLRSREKLFKFEKTFLNTVSRISKCSTTLDMRITWEEFLNETAEIQRSGLDRVALEYFDFQSWAESKVSGKAFPQIIREKRNQELRKAS